MNQALLTMLYLMENRIFMLCAETDPETLLFSIPGYAGFSIPYLSVCMREPERREKE
jgi:hypothetical protein